MGDCNNKIVKDNSLSPPGCLNPEAGLFFIFFFPFSILIWSSCCILYTISFWWRATNQTSLSQAAQRSLCNLASLCKSGWGQGLAAVLFPQSGSSSCQQGFTDTDWNGEGSGNFRSKRPPCSPQGAFLGIQNMAERLHRKAREKDANVAFSLRILRGNDSVWCHLETLFFHMLLRSLCQA